jgi:hypothetical protein
MPGVCTIRLCCGSVHARGKFGGARPAHYTIVIEWPVAGQGSQILRLPVTT